MPISAVVITLDSNETQREAALKVLRDDARLTLGEAQHLQLPAVVDTKTLVEGINLVHEELPRVVGVDFVHVISVDFSDIEDFDEKLPPKRRSRT